MKAMFLLLYFIDKHDHDACYGSCSDGCHTSCYKDIHILQIIKRVRLDPLFRQQMDAAHAYICHQQFPASRFSCFTSTMPLAIEQELFEQVDSMNHSSTSHKISPHDKDYKWKWRLVTEVKKVFSDALTVAFEDFPAKCLMLCCKRDDGEFEWYICVFL